MPEINSSLSLSPLHSTPLHSLTPSLRPSLPPYPPHLLNTSPVCYLKWRVLFTFRRYLLHNKLFNSLNKKKLILFILTLGLSVFFFFFFFWFLSFRFSRFFSSFFFNDPRTIYINIFWVYFTYFVTHLKNNKTIKKINDTWLFYLVINLHHKKERNKKLYNN